MSLRIVRRPRVIQDLVEQYFYLADESIEAAESFLTAVQSTFEQLAQTPHIGVLFDTDHPQLQSIRRWFVTGFENHVIFIEQITGN